MQFTVEYVELENGAKPFEYFIADLDIHERARSFETIQCFLELKNHNLPIKENLSKHLEDGIFELRTSLTHGFFKKTKKTPRKKIEKAKELRGLYELR